MGFTVLNCEKQIKVSRDLPVFSGLGPELIQILCPLSPVSGKTGWDENKWWLESPKVANWDCGFRRNHDAQRADEGSGVVPKSGLAMLPCILCSLTQGSQMGD